MNDKWISEGVFKAIEDATNVHLELTVVDNSNYTRKGFLGRFLPHFPLHHPRSTLKLRMSPARRCPVSDYVSICHDIYSKRFYMYYLNCTLRSRKYILSL